MLCYVDEGVKIRSSSYLNQWRLNRNRMEAVTVHTWNQWIYKSCLRAPIAFWHRQIETKSFCIVCTQFNVHLIIAFIQRCFPIKKTICSEIVHASRASSCHSIRYTRMYVTHVFSLFSGFVELWLCVAVAHLKNP